MLKVYTEMRSFKFIRLRLNTPQFAAGMRGKANRAVAPLSEGGSGYGATWRAIARKSDGGFRFDTPQLAAGSFISIFDFISVGYLFRQA